MRAASLEVWSTRLAYSWSQRLKYDSRLLGGDVGGSFRTRAASARRDGKKPVPERSRCPRCVFRYKIGTELPFDRHWRRNRGTGVGRHSGWGYLTSAFRRGTRLCRDAVRCALHILAEERSSRERQPDESIARKEFRFEIATEFCRSHAKSLGRAWQRFAVGKSTPHESGLGPDFFCPQAWI